MNNRRDDALASWHRNACVRCRRRLVLSCVQRRPVAPVQTSTDPATAPLLAVALAYATARGKETLAGALLATSTRSRALARPCALQRRSTQLELTNVAVCRTGACSGTSKRPSGAVAFDICGRCCKYRLHRANAARHCWSVHQGASALACARLTQRTASVLCHGCARAQQGPVQVESRNLILFSRREAARAGIALPSADSRAQHIRDQLRASPGDVVRIGVVNGLKVRLACSHACQCGQSQLQSCRHAFRARMLFIYASVWRVIEHACHCEHATPPPVRRRFESCTGRRAQASARYTAGFCAGEER